LAINQCGAVLYFYDEPLVQVLVQVVPGDASSRLGALSGFPPFSLSDCFKRLLRGLEPNLGFWICAGERFRT
jgi:hypothetical protein